MKRLKPVLLLSITMLSAALFAGDEGTAPSTPTEPPAPTVTAPAPSPAESPRVEPVAPAGTAGMTVYKDPDTGRLMPVPPAELRELLSEDVEQATSMSLEGLSQTAAPGGGVMINLQGRFQSVMQVTVGADGKVTGHCDTANPEPRKD
jgi:hypothetical protein